jgi:cell wall-associated NlpC family hydrolase
MKIDKWLSKKFVAGRDGYNCWAFARDVWQELTGKDLGNQTPVSSTLQDYNLSAEQFSLELQRLDRPVDPCLVLMQRPRLSPHVGVYFKGKILHLNQSGAFYVPLEQTILSYRTVSYYK